MIGPSVWHGPHHGAHRSTTTGAVFDRSMTSVSNVASVTSITAMAPTLPAGLRRVPYRRVASADRRGTGPSVGGSTVEDDAGHRRRRRDGLAADHVDGAVAPFRFDVIAGGHSNLTYRVVAADGRRFVLRRPPLGHVLASAHDMGREYRIISGLQDSAVPVPPALGFCDDPRVNGAPFYVMGFVDGHVVRDRDIAEAALDARRRGPPPAARSSTRWRRSTPSTSRPPGSATSARHEGYIARQLKRWYGQWNQQKTRELPVVDEVHDALADRDPRAGPGDDRPRRLPPRQLHGRRRRRRRRRARLGDLHARRPARRRRPAAGVLDRPGRRAERVGRPATTAAGFWNRPQWPRATPRCPAATSSQLDFYVAFGYWKLACILEGVYARYLGGALGDRDPAELEPFAARSTTPPPRRPSTWSACDEPQRAAVVASERSTSR